MNIKNNFSKYIGAVSVAALIAGSVAVTTASAQVSISASVNASTSMKGMYMRNGRMGSTSMRMGSTTRMMASSTRMSSTTREQVLSQRQGLEIDTIENHSGSEIAARISSLNTLLGRVNAMTHLSSVEKTSITTEVNNLISELTTLQTKIAVDASSTPTGSRGDLASSSPLRTDMESITKDYRVYALVIPQLDILAAADRGQTLVASLTTLSTKLQTRVTADQSAGDNVTTLQASLSDLNAKVADAQTQMTSAINLTANLVPDNGDSATAASNALALKNARADIQTADTDIKTATTDAQSVVKGVEALGGGKTSGSASVSASTTSIQ